MNVNHHMGFWQRAIGEQCQIVGRPWNKGLCVSTPDVIYVKKLFYLLWLCDWGHRQQKHRQKWQQKALQELIWTASRGSTGRILLAVKREENRGVNYITKYKQCYEIWPSCTLSFSMSFPHPSFGLKECFTLSIKKSRVMPMATKVARIR